MLARLLLSVAFLLLSSAAWAYHNHYPDQSPGISCPADRVVWVNKRTGIYHLEGERWFGRTNSGQFECEKAAQAEGDRATRNGQ